MHPRGDRCAECPTLLRRCGARGAHVASSMVDEGLKRPLTPYFNLRNGTLWNIRAFPASVRLDAGELDHLGPLLGFVGDELAEVSRRARIRHASQRRVP